jgi:Asp-tRNA(Asn)/Glu-tRNA(Gln) amidotransferase A subunit family amidase
LSLPAVSGPSGLPLGLQLVGVFGGDEALLGIGRQMAGILWTGVRASGEAGT